MAMKPIISEHLAGLDHIPVEALEPFQGNLKELTTREYNKLKKSLLENGVIVPFFVWHERKKLLDGHQRARVFIKEGWLIDVPVIYINADNKQDAKQKLLVISSQYGKVTQEGWDKFTFDMPDDWLMETTQFDGLPFVFGEWEKEEPEPESKDAPPQISRADELQKVWQVETGQVWKMGKHLLLCGDCTNPDDVARLMGDDKADLVHADPPYGMGKEKDGIANDNLYREKLDAFQMKWWNAARPFMKDNGSAYTWGNAPDLWRLWYVGGLRDSERLTVRNEVVWDKGDIGAGSVSLQGSAGLRKYPPAGGERSLFFMLGEQGFNNNADNYWEGWEPIRLYLKGEREKMGWDIPTMKTLAGHSDKSRDHWTGKSQWNFVTKDVYAKLQTAAKGDGFKREYDELKREYDELKREFYSTRAYFDNTHDNMTDVWSFQRVTGDDRHGHATPKPVAMMERAIKSSCPDGGLVYVPFCGTAPELIAAENLARQCRAVEISPAYVAVALQRYQDAFGITP